MSTPIIHKARLRSAAGAWGMLQTSQHDSSKELTYGTLDALSLKRAAAATSPNIPRPAASIPTASH